MRSLTGFARGVLALVVLVVVASCTPRAPSPSPFAQAAGPAAQVAAAAPQANQAAAQGVNSQAQPPAPAPSPTAAAPTQAGGIEPGAGQWQPYVLKSGSELRLPPPPDQAVSAAEIEQLKALVSKRDPAALQRIAYWDTGSPAYRWLEIAYNAINDSPLTPPRGNRAEALVSIAIYDVMIATWDSKYAYNRPRPGQADASLIPAVAVPNSPSYPSEHAAAAGAASTVLAYLFPNDAVVYADRAKEAANSQSLAGIQYPSDIDAGLRLGQAVAQKVIERAKADGSDAVWTGSIPAGPGFWKGADPMEPMAGTWKTWVLASGSELRPGPPPAYDSAREKAELFTVRSINRSPDDPNGAMNIAKAYYWQITDPWFDLARLHMFEYGIEQDSPAAARAYAAIYVAAYDADVACFDAKYTYWAIRPDQLDPNLKTVFKTPNHPSYPSQHACVSGAVSGVMEYLFPADAQELHKMADESGMSRVWAGIHFPSDIGVGLSLGRSVADRVVQRVKQDAAGKEAAAK